MKQLEVTSHIPVVDSKGRFTARGYARHMLFDYDSSKLKSSAFSLKEWDFYQISDDRFVLQLTIGHVSYVSSVSANLFDLQTGKKRTVGRMEPFVFRRLGMETNPEKPHRLAYEHNGLFACFEVRENERLLSLTADGADGKTEIAIRLTNCSPDKDKMVIATPFERQKQFYLNYKENCYMAQGRATIGDMSVDFDANAFGLLDCGRGVWPFRHSWRWGSGSTMVDGKPFGFNIGWGFGNTSAATENMFFYDNKAYKLGEVRSEPEGEGYMARCRYIDDAGRLELIAEPVFDNHTVLKVLFVNNVCHQVWSRFSAKAVMDDGSTLEVPPFVAFAEHSVNRW